MLFSRPTFIGIDPTAGQRPFVYAALDGNLRLLALGQGSADDVLAFAAGQREAFVAVSAPRRPNQGIMRREDYRRQLSPPPHPGRWLDLRLVEYLLSQHNIRMPQTYSDEKRCARWMQMGFSLFRRLESLGYRPCPEDEQVRQSLEVYPHACYTVLLGHSPFPKASLEGRLQRQLILHEQKVEVPDPMRFFEEITRHKLLQGVLPEEELYTAAELDALVAAFTAWTIANDPERSTLLGDPDEGQVILPVGELKPRY
jgi:hypothetical protein